MLDARVHVLAPACACRRLCMCASARANVRAYMREASTVNVHACTPVYPADKRNSALRSALSVQDKGPSGVICFSMLPSPFKARAIVFKCLVTRQKVVRERAFVLRCGWGCMLENTHTLPGCAHSGVYACARAHEE
eukprot:6211355-Pleurochrysis_carterae.AAC.1